MPQINSIQLHIQTGNLTYAGTDGDIYLGFGGREFFIDSSKDDFERGASRSYILGEGANILHADRNDPRKPQLFTERVVNFPVYIRFRPTSRTDEWQLQRADIRFNDTFFIEWDTVGLVVNQPDEGIWLAERCGLVAYLTKTVGGPVAPKPT